MNKVLQARAGAGPTRPAARPALAVLLAMALLVAGCGGSDAPAEPEGRAGALAASRPGELLQNVQQRVRALAAQGAGPTAGSALPTVVSVSALAVPGAAPGSGSGAALGADAAAARSQPLLQEAGVDEPDLLQADGDWMHALQPHATQPNTSVLTAWQRDATSGRAGRRGELALAAEGVLDMPSLGMVYRSDRSALAVVSQRWEVTGGADLCGEVCLTVMPGSWMRGAVHVQRVGLAEPGAPQAQARLAIDGQLVDSRRVGDTLVVVSTHAPFLAPLALPADATAAQREAAIAALRAQDLLPGLRRNGGERQPLLADTDCWVQRDNADLSVQFTTITLIDLADPALPQTSRCFIGGTEALYMTPTRLVLATTRYSLPARGDFALWNPDVATELHLFAFDGAQVRLAASGRVDGHLGWQRDQRSLRFSQHEGHLRVLTYTGGWGWVTEGDATTTAPSPARLTVLREDAGTLRTVATLPNAQRPAAIGKPGEQVYGVRFVGARGYVVTFRRTDPLYVLDLADPADPRTAGALEVTGFSEHLVPLGDTHLLGVGRDADANGQVQGLKFALYDVRDAASPREQAALTLGAAGSRSAMDHARLALALQRSGTQARAALPLALTTTAWGPVQRGLQRLAIDTAAGTLQALPLLALPDAAPVWWAPLWQERALIVGAQAYHLHDGVLDTHDW